MSFKALIIDDDANGIQAIKNIIKQFDFPAEIIGSAQTLEEGVSLLKKHQPDLLFLDIEMKNESGFDLLEIWEPGNTKVVFCTGYDQYAIKALKKGAYDYILKPLDYKEFMALFKKLEEDHSPSLQDKKDPAVTNKISIKSPGGIYIIDICEINFLKADGRYTLINYDSGKDCTSSK
ncbi:MAG: response regulator, partial [Crocinitomicaceae bacterium]